MKTKTKGVVVYGIRVSRELLARADKLTDLVSEPGRNVLRAEVLRMAVYRGLEQLEKEYPASPAKKAR